MGLLKKGVIFAMCGIAVLTACDPDKPEPLPDIRFETPANFPAPLYDLAANPVTPAGFALGRDLFYDGILSRDGSISCGFCHQQTAGFTQHGHDLSHGIDDRLTMRNALPIQNLAWEREFFWDGGVFHLDLFAIQPIENENEMGEQMPNVLDKLRRHNKYPAMFTAAFGTPEITTDRFLRALSQFQLMCISSNSKYDKYVRNEGATLNAEELAGLQNLSPKMRFLPRRRIVYQQQLPQQRPAHRQCRRHRAAPHHAERRPSLPIQSAQPPKCRGDPPIHARRALPQSGSRTRFLCVRGNRQPQPRSGLEVRRAPRYRTHGNRKK